MKFLTAAPLLCLKLKCPAALFNGEKVTLSAAPFEKKNKIFIPKEVLTLLGIECEEEYKPLDSIKEPPLVFSGMGLLIFDNGDDFKSLSVEKDKKLLLAIAHSFIFEINTDKLGKEYAPATKEEREGFQRVGRQIRDMLLAKNNKHPFVFGSQEIFDKLRDIYTCGKKTSEYKSIKKIIDLADEYIKHFAELNENGDGLASKIPSSGYGESEYDEGGRHTHSEGRLLETAHLAFAYQMTLDTRYAKLAYYYSEAIITRKHWGPGHFLNCSGATGRLVMIYDWLYNVWKKLNLNTDVIKRGIYNQGLHHGYNSVINDTCDFPSPKQGTGWRFKLKPDNWNSVCNSGMVLGSLCLLSEGVDNAIGDEEYEKITELLGACITSTMDPGLVFTQYAPDGSYVESNSYWSYGTTNLVTTMASLYDSIGTDLGLHHACGFDKTCYYSINSESAEFVGWNYHDGSMGSQNTSSFNPLAVISGDYQLFALRQNHIKNGKEPTMIDLLYHPMVRNLTAPKLSALSLDYAMEGIDAFTVRSGWERGSLYAGIMGGENPNGGSHNQIDSGAFVYHNLGKLWFTDLGSDNYNSRGIANKEGYFSNYALYRRNAEGNNTLALSSLPFGQLGGTRGYMTEHSSGKTASYAIIDNKEVYGEDKVEYARRGMLLTDNKKTLVIKDEVGFLNIDSAFTTAHFDSKCIKAKVSPDGKKCTLTHKDGEKIYVTLLGDGRLKVMDCKNGLLTGTAPAEGEHSRDNYSRLVVRHNKVMSISTSFVISTEKKCPYTENLGMDMWKTL